MKKREKRWWGSGPVALMAEADGYVMARRPSCIPFVLTRAEWLALPPVTPTETTHRNEQGASGER